MTLPDINRVRLQRVVAECEAMFEPADFDELCDAVAQTPWAAKLELDIQTVAQLIEHHSIETKVKVGEVKASPTLPAPKHKLKRTQKVDPPKVESPPKVEEPAPETPKNFYEEGGRGRKQCPACKKYVGGRNANCTNCGHDFAAPKPVVVQPAPAPKPVVVQPAPAPKPVVVQPVPKPAVAVSVAPPPPKPVTLHKEPLRPAVQEARQSSGVLSREFVHWSGGEVWEIKNGVLWQVDPKTEEPLNDRKYQWKFDEEWHTSFLTNIESNVAMWVEQGHRRPPFLPDNWTTRTERLQEKLNHEQALALAGAGIADQEVSDSTGE